MKLKTDYLIKADTMTVNGHVYPKKLLEKAVAEFQEHLAKGSVFCNRDGNTNSLKDLTHKITDCSLENNAVVMEIETLDTEAGKNVELLITECGREVVDIYPVGFGGLIKEGSVETIVDFRFTGVGISSKG